MKTLDELALEYGTDKSSKCHNYTRWYERHFEPIRDNKLVIVEIGVHKGASIRMWHDYFSNAHIFGVDLNPVELEGLDRYTFIDADQSNSESIRNAAEFVMNCSGRVDILIDDGSHIETDQQETVEAFMPYIADGGFYCIEDLHSTIIDCESDLILGLLSVTNKENFDSGYGDLRNDPDFNLQNFESELEPSYFHCCCTVNSFHLYKSLLIMEILDIRNVKQS